MPPPSDSKALHLIVLPQPFFVIKLKQGEEIAPCLLKDLTSGKGSFFSITRTSDEISIVGEAYKWMPSSYKEQSTWMAIKIQGPMEHSMFKPIPYGRMDNERIASAYGHRSNRRPRVSVGPSEGCEGADICVVYVVSECLERVKKETHFVYLMPTHSL